MHTAATGALALDLVEAAEPDVVLLDLGLPDLDGVTVCNHLRRWTTTPIIVLTADGAEDRKVQALDEGADDYLTKPFSLPELLARVRVAIRHRRALESSVTEQTVEIGDLRIDIAAHVAVLGDKALSLTRKEFALLALLARNAGRVLTYRTLLVAGWGLTGEPGSTQSLRTHMAVLRRKLESGANRPSIVNESGVGYRLVLPNAESR